MIRSVSKTVFVHPGETVTFTVDLKSKLSEHANFSIESAHPGGYWGTSIPQLPKDAVVPRDMIIVPLAGVVHDKEKQKQFSVKYLYPTWIRVVQYLSVEEVPTVHAKIRIDTKKWTKLKRLWQKQIIEPPTERVF